MRAPAPWFTRVFMRFNGSFDRFGPTKICRSLIKDGAATRASIDQILAADFDRVLVGHGQLLAAGGREAMRAGFAWLPAAAARAA